MKIELTSKEAETIIFALMQRIKDCEIMLEGKNSGYWQAEKEAAEAAKTKLENAGVFL